MSCIVTELYVSCEKAVNELFLGGGLGEREKRRALRRRRFESFTKNVGVPAEWRSLKRRVS